VILARPMVNHQAKRWKAAEAALRWLIILRSLQQAIYKFRNEKRTATKKAFPIKSKTICFFRMKAVLLQYFFIRAD
jgi:hypothetical protein